MCITRQETWAFAGKNYPTELDAVKAALTEIGTRFVKEFHSQPFQGMLALGADISYLRDRYIDLTGPDAGGGEAPSENATGEPKSAQREGLRAKEWDA